MTSRTRTSIWTPANIVTMIRILLVPVFVIALLSPWPYWFDLHNIISNETKSIIAAVVFILISCTDWIDGYLARSRNEVTDFGKFVDPLADKILVAAALLALIELQVLPSWPVLITLTREFIVAGIRMIAASKGEVIAASWFGKAKTVLQIVAIVLFLIKDSLYLPNAASALSSPLYILSWIVMIAALVFTVISMVDYIAKAQRFLFPRADTVEEDTVETYACIDEEITECASKVISHARAQQVTLGTAESLTGGMIAEALTRIAGSSEVVKGSIVSYAITVKEDVLDVDKTLLAKQGAVDADVALQMAAHARTLLGSDICVSVTGIAGPGGAEPGKPVGTVFMALDGAQRSTCTRLSLLGSREEIRKQTTLFALKAFEDLLSALPASQTIE